MIFTIQDLETIRKYLIATGLTDSQLPKKTAAELSSNDTTVITVGGKEFNIKISELKSASNSNDTHLIDVRTDENSEDLILVKANGDTVKLDSGMSIDEVSNILKR